MVHIVQLRTKNGRLFGRAKNGSIWMHNHQAWTAKQLKQAQGLAFRRADMHEAYDLEHASEARKNFAKGNCSSQPETMVRNGTSKSTVSIGQRSEVQHEEIQSALLA
jgi:hypothetical protein